MNFERLLNRMEDFAYDKFVEKYPDVNENDIYEIALVDTDNDIFEFIVCVDNFEIDVLADTPFYHAMVYNINIELDDILNHFVDVGYIDSVSSLNIQDIIDQMLEIKC